MPSQPTLLDLLTRPGMKLMRALRFPAKMVLMGTMIVAPTLWLTLCQWQVARRAGHDGTLPLMIGSGAILLLGYLAYCYFRTAWNAMRVLQGSVTQLASGDLGAQVRLRRTDELVAIADALDGMTGRLSEMVSDIRSNSAMVARVGLKLAEDTGSLSERTIEQAASVEQTASSVRRIDEALRTGAESAQAVDRRASEVRAMAESGGQAVRQAVHSMQDIQSSSQRVQEIIGVIESLSFQTNILALNAAVEAARAGEQGRGFAVVAAEVRALAQRSAESAKEIRSLITASAEHVEHGVQHIDGASRTFDAIVEGVREVADNVRVIATSTAEQSTGLGRITQAVERLDEITQQNTRMVEQAFHGSKELSERVGNLGVAVQSFRLRQGSADEAAALVEKALALFKTQGRAALRRITETPAEYADRDMYVFAFDREGVYRALAGRPEKVGTAVRDIPGVDGDRLVADAFEQAGHGGGWIDYVFTNPQTGSVDLKTSYIVPIEKDLVLGCGVYKTRGDASRPSLAALAPERMRREQESRLAPLIGTPPTTTRSAAPVGGAALNAG